MSEPTKEQIETAIEFLSEYGCYDPDDDKELAVELGAVLAAETAPLHEKIASLEKQLAGALQLSETHRKAWQAALAPLAQTQQGLSEEEAASLWILLNRPGMTSNKGIALIMERCGRPSDLEKQPSPAAAPAQLSDVPARVRLINIADHLADCARRGRAAIHDSDVNAYRIMDDLAGRCAEEAASLREVAAALAGQPARDTSLVLAEAMEQGEKDREAMERQHDLQKLPGRIR